LLWASDLMRLLNTMAGRVSGRVFVRRRCVWKRWVYCIKIRGGIPVSASKAVSSPYTCRARAKERLRLDCSFLTSVVLWI